jgi:hypothetical protein
MSDPSSRNIRCLLQRTAPILPIGFLLFMMTACASGPKMEGMWEIQEEDKSYMATLDPQGNGTYTWKNGTIKTTEFIDRRWKGTWQQTGNDREGGFEVLLSEDGTQAEGVWWYTRMGDHEDIPPKKFGGDYLWVRQSPQSIADSEK